MAKTPHQTGESIDYLRSESGTLNRRRNVRIALGYPAGYNVGASSLGFQTVYRVWNEDSRLSCERFFLDDICAPSVRTLETGSSPGQMDAIAFSVACETELLAIVALLKQCGLAPLSIDRGPEVVPVIIGGPITWLSPRLIAPLADVVVHGEGDEALSIIAQSVVAYPSHRGRCDKASMLRSLPHGSGIWVPALENTPPSSYQVSEAFLPARAATWSPLAELKDLFLVEISRGCPRGCGFCVMSGVSKGTGCFRCVDPAQILAAVPDDAPGVGLVGAAVTDHPRVVDIVESLVELGKRVSLSSIRADRVDDALVSALVKGGLRTLTLAADGSSETLRRRIHKGITRDHLLRAAQIAASHNLSGMKLYSMIGLPGESDEDIAEFAELALALQGILRISLGVQAFVPKPRTPLSDVAMLPVAALEKRLALLKRLLKGRDQLAPASPKWSWIDWKLAHGEEKSALAAIAAYEEGGAFGAWKKAVEEAGL